MAEVKLQMQALGLHGEECNGCEKPFKRAQTMNAVVSSDGESLGWYCDPCIESWEKEAPHADKND